MPDMSCSRQPDNTPVSPRLGSCLPHSHLAITSPPPRGMLSNYQPTDSKSISPNSLLYWVPTLWATRHLSLLPLSQVADN